MNGFPRDDRKMYCISGNVQLSKNDQAIFLSMKIPLARLTDVSKVVDRNRRPLKLFVFFLSSPATRQVASAVDNYWNLSATV